MEIIMVIKMDKMKVIRMVIVMEITMEINMVV